MSTKLSLCFATSGLPFSGDSLEKGSLGGSETAVICLARALAKHGHNVTIFCNCERPGQYDGVRYSNIPEFQQAMITSQYDAFIVSRWPELLQIPCDTGMRILWLHDMPTDVHRLMSGCGFADYVYCLSDYHKQQYAKIAPDLEPLIKLTRNGVDVDLIAKQRRDKVPGRLIYTSRPERGLHTLLIEILPRLLQQRSDLQLYYANYDVSSLQLPDDIRRLIAQCDQLAKRFGKNVVQLGHLPKAELYSMMSSAQLLLYPTAFPEISCITAIEAQACGTPVITTSNFALRETCGSGCVLIDGKPTSEEYIQSFCDATLNLLSNESDMSAKATACKSFVSEKEYSWDQIAAQWEQDITTYLAEKVNCDGFELALNMFRNNDVVAADTTLDLLDARHYSPLPSSASYELHQLVDHGLSAAVYRDEHQQLETAAHRLEGNLPRFKTVLEVIKQLKPPKLRILDYACGDAAFGLFVKRVVPESDIVCVDHDSEIRRRVRVFAEKSSLDILVCSEDDLTKQEPFDIVFAGNVIDATKWPHSILRGLTKFCKTSTGRIITTTRYGTKSATLNHVPDRLWNFCYTDLCELQPKLEATFTSETSGAGGELIGYWISAFKPFEPFSTVDITRKLRRELPYQSIGCCLIIKNEEDNLLRCLKRVRPIVDHLVVCDTGSTDSSIEIAGKLADEIRQVTFDNFAQARNTSISGLTTDWILWLDADEVLVNPDKLRKYLYTKLFNAYVIRQNHLMIDLHGTSDTPIRVFRNNPDYQFVGLVHEHIENVSKGYDEPVTPALVLPDVDLAHTGYINERIRRQKVSRRNMELLQRDLVENPNRQITKVLAIRDYLNIVKWRSPGPAIAQLQPGSQEHELLCAAVSLFLQYFTDRKHKYHHIAWPMYQEALMILGKNNLCAFDQQLPPFEIELLLRGSVGGLSDNMQARPERLWFISYDQMHKYLDQHGAMLAVQTGIADEASLVDDLAAPPPMVFQTAPDYSDLLRLGTNVIPERMS